MATPLSCVIAVRLGATVQESATFDRRLADEGQSPSGALRVAVAGFSGRRSCWRQISINVRHRVAPELDWLLDRWRQAATHEPWEVRSAFRAIEAELVSAITFLHRPVEDPQRMAGRLVRRRGMHRERPASPDLWCRVSRAEAAAWRAAAVDRGLSLSCFLRVALDERFGFRQPVAHGGSLPNPIAHPTVTALRRAAQVAVRLSGPGRQEDWRSCTDLHLDILRILLTPGATSWT